MPEAEKRITTDVGGELLPAQGFPDDEEEKLPEVGIIVSPPAMAIAIADERKTLLIKSKPVDIDPQDYVLVSLRKALGVVTLGERMEMARGAVGAPPDGAGDRSFWGHGRRLR